MMRAKFLTLFAVSGLLIGSLATATAQGPSEKMAPGQQMQDKGSVPGQPGASGYAPGQQMKDQGSVPGQPGASGYAPGQTKKMDDATTGSTTGTDAGGKSSK
jgi:hypothetical protein